MPYKFFENLIFDQDDAMRPHELKCWVSVFDYAGSKNYNQKFLDLTESQFLKK